MPLRGEPFTARHCPMKYSIVKFQNPLDCLESLGQAASCKIDISK